MAFVLSETVVEIRADTKQSDAGIAATETKLRAVPALKVVGLKVDTTQFDAGIAHASQEIAKLRDDRGRFQPAGRAAPVDRGGVGATYGMKGEGYDLAPWQKTVAAVRPALTLDNRGFAAALARAKADLDKLPRTRLTTLMVNIGPFKAGLASAKAALGEALLTMKAMAAASAASAAYIVAGAALGAVAVGAKSAIMGAAGLNETMSKVDVVFGDSAAKVKGFAESMSAAFGTSRQEVLDSAAGFGLIAKAAGQTQEQAAGLAVSFARLADDASSFYNVPLDDALMTIKSALVGESEPIRRFGVLLNETAVKSEAVRLGLAGVGKELTESQKVMARASLIQKGMADAQGDHARTADSFANQWREFTGRVYEFAVAIGQIALPVLNAFLRVLNPIARALTYVADILRQTIDLFGEFFQKAGAALNLTAKVVPTVAPGGGLEDANKKALSAGGAATPGATAGAETGVKRGLAAARETVAKEAADADQKRLEDQVRAEKVASDKKTAIARAEAAIYRQTWIEAEAKKIEARLNAAQQSFAASEGEIEYAKRYNAEQAKTFAARNFEAAKIEGTKLEKPPDLTAARNFLERVQSTVKDLAPQALAMTALAKQQGLGLLAKGAGVIDARGETARKEREAKGFQSQFLTSEGLSQRIQTGALDKTSKLEEKQIAENTRQAVAELRGGFADLTATLKGLGLLATYR